MHKQTMNTTIPEQKKDNLFSSLREANLAFNKFYPGDRSERQPVHTVYGGANLFKYNSAEVLGKRALESFQTYAPDFITFGKIFKLNGFDEVNGSHEKVKKEYEGLSADEKKKHPAHLSYEVYHKVIKKLEREAIEDFRIDFISVFCGENVFYFL
jgi:hypothetical protein